jgi:SpoVK/Ycf46/Vps4 family AAA+-type ATPase
MPSCIQRAKILEVILKGENVEDDIDYDYVASLCEGYSGSDLTDLCKQAAYFPIRELLEQEKSGQLTSETPRPLKQSDLEKVLSIGKTSRVAAAEYGNRKQTDMQSRLGSSSEQLGVSLTDFVKFLSLMGSAQRTTPEN